MPNRYSIILVLPLLFAGAMLLLMADSNSENSPDLDRINAVIGDESYLYFVGEKPTGDVEDELRIRLHLEYVEGILRNRPVDHLSDEQKANRDHKLDLLREYTLRGEFPYNDGHPDQRRPTFISDDGNICAVGYLVEKTARREVAEAINEMHKYDFIGDIESDVFDEWVENSGFTIDELAMIQPMYRIKVDEATRNRNEVKVGYGIGSTLLTGLNVSYLAGSSGEEWVFESDTYNHLLAAAAGTGAIVLGVMNLDNERVYHETIHRDDNNFWIGSVPYREVTETNYARTALSVANISAGALTVAKAVVGLHRNIWERRSASLDITQIETNIPGSREPVSAIQLQVRF